MLATLLALAATTAEEEPSKIAFYVAGGALVFFALAISAIGVRGAQTFPPSKGARTGVLGLCALLVAAAMLTAVVTA